MDGLTFEQKVAMLALSNSDKRKELLNRWAQDSELHFALEGKRMPMEEYMKQHKFAEDAKASKEIGLNTKDHGWTAKKQQKLIGQIPASIFFGRPEFSFNLPAKERAANIRKFLNEYPAFKTK